MYSGRLSMFTDGPASQYVPVTYDVARVSCPVAIVYGGSDHLGEPPDVRAVVRVKVEAMAGESAAPRGFSRRTQAAETMAAFWTCSFSSYAAWGKSYDVQHGSYRNSTP